MKVEVIWLFACSSSHLSAFVFSVPSYGRWTPRRCDKYIKRKVVPVFWNGHYGWQQWKCQSWMNQSIVLKEQHPHQWEKWSLHQRDFHEIWKDFKKVMNKFMNNASGSAVNVLLTYHSHFEYLPIKKYLQNLSCKTFPTV